MHANSIFLFVVLFCFVLFCCCCLFVWGWVFFFFFSEEGGGGVDAVGKKAVIFPVAIKLNQK